jgi:hypothetical protein
LTTVLLAGCANDPDAYPHGEEAASWTNGSVLRTLALYVGVPALILGVLALAAWLPGMIRSRRYRPSSGWSAAPVWFAGPSEDPVRAVQHAQVGDVARGGNGGTW